MYEKLGSFVSRRWVLVIGLWIVMALMIAPMFQRKVLGFKFTPTWDEVTKDGDLAYLPARMTSVRGQLLYGEAFPDNKSRSEIVVILERNEGLQPTDLALAQQVADFFEAEKAKGAALTAEGKTRPHELLAVVDVLRPAGNLEGTVNGAEDLIGKKLIAPDKKAVIVVASLEHELIAVDSAWAIQTVQKMMNAKLVEAQSRAVDPLPAGLNWGLTGSAAVGGDTLASSNESIQNIHKATGILVVLILLVVYRAPVLVVIPLFTIGVAVFTANHVIALLTQLQFVPGFGWFEFEIFKTSEIFIFTICFGSGTDFCLFLISRYREEMERGHDKATALKESIGQVGEALTGSAMTTVCGLGMMYFSDFGKFTYSGPAIALCLIITLLACLTLAPAMLRAFGRYVFWPFGVQLKPAAEDNAPDKTVTGRFWTWASDRIMAYPGIIMVVSLVALAPLAYEGLDVKVSYDLLADLEATRPSKVGTKMMQQHFPAGEMGPITMLVDKPDFHFDNEEGRKLITEFTKELYALSTTDIKSVRSLMYPLGDAPRKLSLREKLKSGTLEYHNQSAQKYVSLSGPRTGQVTRFDVVTAYDPFSTDAERVLEKLEGFTEAKASDPSSPWYGATFDFIGTTAGTRDLKAVITSDERLIQRLVVLAVTGVVLWILRRPLICGYLIFTVIFSYLVTIGATELVFAWMYPGFEGLDWKVPIFLFVILVAVGEDYNIYLATRVFEEERRLGRMAGLRAAIIKTGGIITSCGVIMAGTFVSLMSGSLRAMHELGFALTLGVILDTFIVRPVLVPAFLAWLYKVMPERTPQGSTVVEETSAPSPSGHMPSMAASSLLEPLTIPAKPHTEMASRRALKR